MRPIDADALKGVVFSKSDNIEDLWDTAGVLNLINNAPTVERPQGEWEEPFESNGRTYHKCNHCHISSEVILFDNFCPNCGAQMKGGTE